MGNENSIDVKTSLFGIKLVGPNAILILLFLLMLALSALVVWENFRRENEHMQMMCSIKLNLFMNTIPKGTSVDWSNMPVDLYPCIPKFLYERPVR